MYGITSRTIILLGDNVRVLASAGLSSDVSLDSSAEVRITVAPSELTFDLTLTNTTAPAQGHQASATLDAGTVLVGNETAIFRAHASLISDTEVSATGSLRQAAESSLSQNVTLGAAGGWRFPVTASTMTGTVTLVLNQNPGVRYDAGTASLASSVTVNTSASPVFRLALPTGTGVFTRDRLWQRYPITTGITMLINSGAVTLKEYVSDIELRDADAYYMGGYRHQITAAEKAVIVSAGYGDLIEEA